jgi:hypothetical protein
MPVFASRGHNPARHDAKGSTVTACVLRPTTWQLICQTSHTMKVPLTLLASGRLLPRLNPTTIITSTSTPVNASSCSSHEQQVDGVFCQILPSCHQCLSNLNSTSKIHHHVWCQYAQCSPYAATKI